MSDLNKNINITIIKYGLLVGFLIGLIVLNSILNSQNF